MYLLGLLTFFSTTFLCAAEFFTESLYPAWGQTFAVQKKLLEEKTEEQDLLIFENELFGKVLVLDGVVQVTEKDEFVYHEMMTHVPLLAHGSAKKVLIIGGGDGGILREVLRHQTVERVVLVEIDAGVIEFSQKHLPYISQGAFADPRLEIRIEDGCQFVKETHETFDVILCDSTDPTGPGAVLFTSEFYKDCHNRLSPRGIFVNQNGVPFTQERELVETYQNRRPHFAVATFYLAVVPTYVGGFMTLGWGTDCPDYARLSIDELTSRMQQLKGPLRYYTPELHQACFALPKFIKEALESAQSS